MNCARRNSSAANRSAAVRPAQKSLSGGVCPLSVIFTTRFMLARYAKSHPTGCEHYPRNGYRWSVGGTKVSLIVRGLTQRMRLR